MSEYIVTWWCKGIPSRLEYTQKEDAERMASSLKGKSFNSDVNIEVKELE